MLRFFLLLASVLVVLSGIAWLGGEQQWWPLPLRWKQVIVFLFFMTGVIGMYLMRIRKKQPEAFTQFYLLSIAVKMTAGLVFIFSLLNDNPAEAASTVALFMAAYICFTLAEVVFFVRE
jgi:Na+-translocating ferredoxin:NAD+ oxidoreductase RnfA subunit